MLVFFYIIGVVVTMIFSFSSFCNRVKKNSERKVKYVVYGSYYGYTWIAFLLSCFFLDFVLYSHYFLFFFFLIFFLLLFFISTRRMGFGMGEEHFLFVRFGHFRFKEKEIYEILFDNIKYLQFVSFFGFHFVKMSFLDNTGRFKKIHLFYHSIVIGLSVTEQKRNGLKITEKLLELQKILDRGDF